MPENTPYIPANVVAHLRESHSLGNMIHRVTSMRREEALGYIRGCHEIIEYLDACVKQQEQRAYGN